MDSFTYKVFNLHFSNQCETSNSYLYTKNFFFKCEFIHYTPPQAEVISSIYMCIVVAGTTTEHVVWPPHCQEDFWYKERVS